MPTETRHCTTEECGKHLEGGHYTSTSRNSGSCDSQAYIRLGENRSPRAVTQGQACCFGLSLSRYAQSSPLGKPNTFTGTISPEMNEEIRRIQ
jgi:hypothetical protein